MKALLALPTGTKIGLFVFYIAIFAVGSSVGYNNAKNEIHDFMMQHCQAQLSTADVRFNCLIPRDSQP